ncbi:MAG TPA: NAD-dependent epimerase/dehydratase family protein [Dehalococcoidia bacterium]|nr:NAD-dependent epimerase/dehydratase family protein [Dehalococcoidia bacterium]
MTVLVTGAGGFLGRNLVHNLLDDGFAVAGVDNFITSDRRDMVSLAGRPGFAFAELDITRPEFGAFAGKLGQIEAVYHLACPTGVPNTGPLAYEMMTTCYEGSKAALEIARAHGAPALLTSTAEVYGNPLVVPQSETYSGNVDPLGARKGYEEGKRAAEALFAIYHERYGVAAKIVRVFNTYGPGMCLDDTRVIPAFLKAALSGQALTMHGAGGQTRCYTYAGDMVNGIRLAMAKGAPARAYNLGSQQPVTVRDLAGLVLRLTGSLSSIISIDRPSHDHDSRLPDTTRAHTELGWSRGVELEDGLRASIADFRRRMGLGEEHATGRETAVRVA